MPISITLYQPCRTLMLRFYNNLAVKEVIISSLFKKPIKLIMNGAKLDFNYLSDMVPHRCTPIKASRLRMLMKKE